MFKIGWVLNFTVVQQRKKNLLCWIMSNTNINDDIRLIFYTLADVHTDNFSKNFEILYIFQFFNIN